MFKGEIIIIMKKNYH